MAEPAVPQVANIAPVQTAPTGVSQGIGDYIGQIAQQANAPLPSPYTQGTNLAQPHVPEVRQVTPRENVTPTGGAAQQAATRKNNGIGSLLHLVGASVNQIQQKKNDLLKDDIKNVMSAKQNVQNAQAVLQLDPTNKLAQGVLAANKKQLEAILTDPKKAKQIQKAMDISFTDMDKNKTNEIKAFQDAVKEHKAAGAFASDNPQEHAVAQLASRGASDGNAPKPVAQPTTQQQPAAQPQQPQVQPRSQTPYADAALAKDQPTIENNPLYAQALKQKQDAQKQLTQFVIPKMIAAETQKQIQEVRDGNAATREQYRAATTLQKDFMNLIARAKLADANNTAAMQRVASRNANQLATTNLRVNASLQIAEDNRLGKENQAKIKSDAFGALDKDIATVTNTLVASGKRAYDINNNPSLTPAQKAEGLKQVELSKQMDTQYLKALQKMRAEKFGIQDDGTPSGDSKSSNEPGFLKSAGTALGLDLTQLPTALLGGSDGNDQSAGDDNTELESVGSSDSDESGGDDDEANFARK